MTSFLSAQLVMFFGAWFLKAEFRGSILFREACFYVKQQIGLMTAPGSYILQR